MSERPKKRGKMSSEIGDGAKKKDTRRKKRGRGGDGKKGRKKEGDVLRKKGKSGQTWPS